MSGTVSHLVGGEVHVARRVQVRVLLLPPRIGVLGDGSLSLGWGSVGHWKAHPVRSGEHLRGLRVQLAPFPPKYWVCWGDRLALPGRKPGALLEH
jgi:hypothetical protein